MTTLRAIGHFAGAVVMAVALAGCGDDGDTAATDDAAAAAEESDDMSEDADAAPEQESGGADDAGSDDASEEDADDSGDDGESTDGDSGSGDGGSDSAAPGVYRDYSADAVADTSYDTTILFFWASWCPECRAFEQAIQDDGVPDGVQILKTDYDTEQDLKEQYGITVQSSFVKVDSDGDELSKWFGYGEDKSVDTILEQLG